MPRKKFVNSPHCGNAKKICQTATTTSHEALFFADGELYSGTTADFSGSDALIYRDNIRTEQNDLRHLNGKPHISSGSLRNFPNIRRIAHFFYGRVQPPRLRSRAFGKYLCFTSIEVNGCNYNYREISSPLFSFCAPGKIELFKNEIPPFDGKR